MSTSPMSASPDVRITDSGSRSPFVPLLLGILAFLAWTAFQTSQLVGERSTLRQTHARQSAQLDQAQKLRNAADSLAAKTQKLADAGDANAQLVMAQLKQRGIAVNPNAPTPAPPR